MIDQLKGVDKAIDRSIDRSIDQSIDRFRTYPLLSIDQLLYQCSIVETRYYFLYS